MQLPTRPESHVKDTIGYKRLLNFFRDEWIIRPIFPDYGVDYEIEPWKNSNPINRVTKIQLKNNDSINELTTDINGYQFKVSSINYLNKLDNSYIISLTKGSMFAFKVDALTEAYNINQSVEYCSIPLVYKRNFKSVQYQNWIINTYPRIIFNLLGSKLALDELETKYGERSEIESYYLITVKGQDESDFFLREEFANFGYYYSTLQRGKNHAIEKLLSKLPNSTPLVQRGIIEGLSHLNFNNEETKKIALDYIESDNSQEILIGLMHLSKPLDNTYLDLFAKVLYSDFSVKSCIVRDNEFHGLELTAIESLFKISTVESISLVVEMFCSTAFKPTEVNLIYNLFSNCKENIKAIILSIVNKINNTSVCFSDYHKMLDEYLVREGKTRR